MVGLPCVTFCMASAAPDMIAEHARPCAFAHVHEGSNPILQAMNQLLLAIADTIPNSVKQDETSREGSGRRRQTMWLDEDIPSGDDEEERTEKRVKLTEAAQAVGEQVAALQVSCSLKE